MLTYYRKQLIKSGIIIAFILVFALVMTHYIYYKFKDTRDHVSNSKSLSVTFHEKASDQVSLLRVTPVSDSVGLSSHAYTFTIKNNMSTTVGYSVKLVQDLETVLEDDCSENQMPLSIIKGAIHKDKEENRFFMVSDLKDNTILSRKLKGGAEVSYTVRFWTTTSTLPMNHDLHFHGKIQVLENGVDIATATE